MMPRDFDPLHDAPQPNDVRMVRVAVAFVVFFWLVIALCLIWLARHPREVGEFFGLLAAGFGMDRY